MTYNEILR